MLNGTLRHRIQAGNRLQQLLLAGTGNAGNPENLAAHGGEGDVVQLLYALTVIAGDSAENQAFYGVFIFRTVDVQRDGMADHHVGQRLGICVAGVDRAYVLALAQHRDLVRKLHHLIELVRDDDDGLAVFLHVAQNGEELFRLLRGEDGGRLVEDQDVRAAVEHLDDLHGLLLRNGHIIDLLRRIDLKAVTVADFLHFGVGGPDVQPAALVQAEDDVFRGGKNVNELVVLVDHADLVVKGVLRGADGDGLAVSKNFALIRKVDARQHVHQGRLTAAVFTQQGENLTAPQTQTDAVVCDDGAEAFGDVSQLNCVNSFQGCHPFLSAPEEPAQGCAGFYIYLTTTLL